MIDPQTEQTVKHSIDGAIGLGAITWPMWVQLLQTSGAIITFLGGMVLLGLRIMIAWHEWKTRKHEGEK